MEANKKPLFTDSSAPKSSAEEDDEDNLSNRIPELNSPASITDDLVCALLPPGPVNTTSTAITNNSSSNSNNNTTSSLATQLPTSINNSKSPKKVINESKPPPPQPQSLYYYSDILKKREKEEQELKETKRKSRQSTSSEPAGLVGTNDFLSFYKKSSSLDVPDTSNNKLIDIVETPNDVDEQQQQQQHHHQEDEQQQQQELNPEEGTPKRYSITEEGVRIIRCSTPSTTTSDDSDCSECQKRREWHAKALELVRKTCNIQVKTEGVGTTEVTGEGEVDENSMPPHRLLGPAVCACAAPAINDDIDEFFRPRSIFYVHAQGAHECEDCAPNPQLNKLHKSNSNSTKSRLGSDNSVNTQDDEMSSGKRRQVYETAFDCKITKSDDDLDEMDKITKHSVLLQINENGNNINKSSHKTKNSSSKRHKNSKNQKIQESEQQAITMISNNLENIHIENASVDQMNNTTTIPTLGYTPSPPSTAPLPMKFPGKHDRFFMNSIKSAPNLPSSNPAHPRLKDLRLPIKSLQQQHQQQSATSNDSSLLDTSYMNSPPSISRTRDRPRSIVLESGRVLELRKSGGGASGGSVNQHHHHGSHTTKRHNYSSTESMATSSSGSMESLRSSTSEGNRSTSSSESRHSTSLSSHSSDGPSVSFPLRAPVVIHSKLHILSPISDKSSQEQASEVSELSKKPSPISEKTTNDAEGGVGGSAPTKRRPPNKSLMQLKDEILGSDSGISLHSREENKSSVIQKLALPKLNFQSSEMMTELSIPSIGLPQDLRDLPFDIPKLRRRKVLIQQV